MITIFPVMDFPAYDLAAIDVFDHIQVIMLPDDTTWAIRNIPAPDLIGPGRGKMTDLAGLRFDSDSATMG
jgi:hypothetical protein